MTRPNAHSVVSRFIECLSALDVDGMASCLSDDILLELPAAPAGMPQEISGMAGFRAFFDPVAQLWDDFALFDVAVHPSAHDPGIVSSSTDPTPTTVAGCPTRTPT